MAHSVELTFGPGNTQQDVMIAIIDDRRLEHDEQLNSVVSLTVADPAVDLSPAVASITIIDNDSKLSTSVEVIREKRKVGRRDLEKGGREEKKLLLIN